MGDPVLATPYYVVELWFLKRIHGKKLTFPTGGSVLDFMMEGGPLFLEYF